MSERYDVIVIGGAAVGENAAGYAVEHGLSAAVVERELAEAGEDVPASVPLSDIRSGGPPPDGIPPIDDPVFDSVARQRGWRIRTR